MLLAKIFLASYLVFAAAESNIPCWIHTVTTERACLGDRNTLCAGKKSRELKNCLADAFESTVVLSEACEGARQQKCSVDQLAAVIEVCRGDAQALCQNVLAISSPHTNADGQNETQKGVRTCLAQNLEKISSEECRQHIVKELEKKKSHMGTGVPFKPAGDERSKLRQQLH